MQVCFNRKICFFFSIIHIINLQETDAQFIKNRSTYMIPSIFEKFPPYIHFPHLNNCQEIPKEIKQFLNWPNETSRIMQRTLKCAGINLLPAKTFRALESYTDLLKTTNSTKLRPNDFRKIWAMPVMHLLADKSKLKTLHQNLEQRLRIKLPWLISSYNLPREMSLFRSTWEKGLHKYWIAKPPLGSESIGVKIISHWKEAPEMKKKLNVAKYIHNPILFNGKKIELRTFFLVTGFNPLRIFHLVEFDRFKLQYTNYTMDKESLNNPCIHFHTFIPECFTNYSMEYDVNNIAKIFDMIKENGADFGFMQEQIYSIVITTLLECENNVIDKGYSSAKRKFIILCFDFFIDENLKIWLNEINLTARIFYFPEFYLKFPEIFNIIGINFPSSLSVKAKNKLLTDLNTNQRKYTWNSEFQMSVTSNATYDDQLEPFRSLGFRNIIQLAEIEDELSRVNKDVAKRIFPSDNIIQYLPVIHSSHSGIYQYLNKWEKLFKHQRSVGRKFLNEQINTMDIKKDIFTASLLKLNKLTKSKD